MIYWGCHSSNARIAGSNASFVGAVLPLLRAMLGCMGCPRTAWSNPTIAASNPRIAVGSDLGMFQDITNACRDSGAEMYCFSNVS